MYLLAPTLTAKLSPPILTGDPGENAIELLCTAAVAEDVMLASYQFTWIKDDAPVDLSNDRIVVCTIKLLYSWLLSWIERFVEYNCNNTHS